MSRLLAAVVLLLLQLPGVHLQGLGDVRLAGYGATRLGGRVEFFENGEWKGICNDQFGGEDANVICRQLGLGHATKIINQDRDYILKRFLRSRRDYTYNRFGVGPAVRITDLDCNGNETHILNCPFQLNNDVNRFTYCQLHEVVGVQCDNYLPQPYNGQVNLIGGIYPSEGRLAVFFNGRWGGVCREDFDRTNLLGDTICRQLGYTNVDFARINSSGSDLYGPALERTWLDGLSCSGLESSRPVCLKSCLPTRTAPQPSQEVQCNLGQVGLRCVYGFASRNPSLVGTKKSCEVEVGATPSEGDVRLMNGSLPHLGRLEVYLKGVWGTVCGAKSQVNRRVGDVVCRQLGYTSWDTLHHRSSVAGYGSGSGPRHITKLNCTGLEDSILQCRRENATFSPCSDPDILAVQCSNNTNGVVFGAVTMEGGSGGHGQLYVNTEGYTPLCDHTFGLREANVACRQMGYESAIGMVKNSFYGFGRRPAGVTHIQCHGNETHLLECNYRNDTFERCGDSDQIGLQCSSSNDEREGGLRLVNSPDTNSGLVEMFVEGHWNRLCSNLFSETAADVACRQLGFTGSIEVIKDGRFGSTDSGIFIVHQCHGSEESLFDCDHTPIHPNFCQKDIAISCSRASPQEEGAVRLTGGTEVSGRLEVYEYGRWGSVCQNKFDPNEAFVACKQLGFYNYSGFTNSFGRPVREDVKIPINIFSIHCNGTEETLISCDHDVSIRLCNHTLDIILTCAECTKQCQNGGLLDEDICSCNCTHPDYIGTECEVCSISCENGGTPQLDSCTCACPDFYGGDHCGECTKQCQNGGLLDEDICSCNCTHPDYIGTECEVCSISCENGGTPQLDSCTCACPDFYGGDHCGDCVKSCANDGELSIDACSCNCSNSAFSGVTCEECPLFCLNSGILDSTTCSCACTAGFTGSLCHTAKPVSSGLSPAITAGLSTGILLLVVLVILMFSFMAVVYALRRRKQRIEAQTESDWIPATHAENFDINFDNPQFDEDNIEFHKEELF
uniref:Deleted in malignant brain tumors 1 protein-like protein 1 n=1 Tax=Halisarca dujardinii TaxID=2583056 RepID=A0AA96S2X9_HALDU|nr:deleted in malignant brain tumors 1 protein-like protein 1 [Halisarca dujardinii]